MKSFTNQQKFMAVILAIYIPSHLLAFYVYYNPPNNPWEWVDKITVIFPQMNNLSAFRVPFYAIGGRLALMLSATYLPMLVVGVLLFSCWIKYGEKNNLKAKGIAKFFMFTYLFLCMCGIHYVVYWTRVGYGYELDFMHPLLFPWPPIMCGLILGALVLGTYQVLSEEKK